VTAATVEAQRWHIQGVALRERRDKRCCESRRADLGGIEGARWTLTATRGRWGSGRIQSETLEVGCAGLVRRMRRSFADQSWHTKRGSIQPCSALALFSLLRLYRLHTPVKHRWDILKQSRRNDFFEALLSYTSIQMFSYPFSRLVMPWNHDITAYLHDRGQEMYHHGSLISTLRRGRYCWWL
jgi:hypothetical protein